MPETLLVRYPHHDEMYQALGLETLSPTKVFAQLMREKVEG